MLPPRPPPSGKYLVTLNGDINVQDFIDRLRDDIKEQVEGRAKGVIGTSAGGLCFAFSCSQIVQVVSTRVLAVSSPPTPTQWCSSKKMVKSTRGL